VFLSSNVQVTLGILAALIEKSPKDVALIAPCVLKILDLILRSNDISMIESSLPTFEALCLHHDATPLFADQSYLSQYESIVRHYAALASKTKPPAATQGTLSRPMQARWRTAGLHAIKSVATSEALSSVTDRQIDVIVPLILENLWNPDEEALDTLVGRVEVEDKVESEKMLRRRTSVGTAGTAETAELNPATFSGTANDADLMAEEDIGVLAMQCLKSIFIVPNRPQITAATMAILKFIFDKVAAGESVVELSEKGKHDSGWAISIYKLICRWAPVQDRYVILVVAMDTLVNNPVKEDKMDQQVALISIIGSILRSDVNLIGLSVMDVLLGLVNQIRKLFGPTSGVSRSGSTVEEKFDLGDGSSSRRLLVDRLERCIGDVATHVYYADQISDMIVAIFARLRPRHSPSANSTPQGERADANEGAPDTSVPDLGESQSSIDNYFSYNKGRVSALHVIKNILLVANPKLKMSGNMNLSRNRVPLQVWEGTYWLLRDPDGEVRKAYVDAFSTWLDRETTPADLLAKDDTHHRGSLRQGRDLSSPISTRRAVSNASNRETLPRRRRPQFLAHLHLAVYDNALQFVDFEADLVILHILLTKLVFRLGVNAVRFGIPMIYRLQEDILEMESPIHKMRIAALCHGYFWALTEKFDFEGSSIGRAIHNEIVRRRDQKFWVEGIHVPLPLLSSVGMPGQVGSQPTLDTASLETGELLPFDDRSSLIECIATCYEQSIRSPPASPAASPNRSHGNPILGSALTASPTGDHDSDFPSAFRDQMETEWSREAVIAALAAEGKA
jgi:protein EFR3